MNNFSRFLTGLPLSALACAIAQAQPAFPSSVPSLAPVTITANPLGATELIAPTEAYTGPSLLLRSKSTLGETLDGTPGVSSTYFGPNASRPVVRGLDGDRIRILQNGGASIDASALSFDHAVPGETLTLQRVEVLRGPGALLYGGNAAGGVINLFDERIAREALFDGQGGVTGRLDLGWGSASSEKTGAAALETGTDRFALHVDVAARDAGDVAVPVVLACTRAGSAAQDRRICNSAAWGQSAGLGGSVFFDQGYLGASLGGNRSFYGTVAEDQVTIGMKSDRAALEGEIRGLGGPLQSLKVQLGRSVYAHTEFEAGVPGTAFRNQGTDLRLQARHASLGALDGVWGLQIERSRFSADGTEAFAPYSSTGQQAVFAHEELPTAWGRLSFGARLESVQVASYGNPLLARFAAASRSFSPRSYALGALWKASAQWQITSNLAWSERAPKDYELFADGPHLATRTYELGQPAAALERSLQLDLGAAWRSGAHAFQVSAFFNRFSNYLSLQASGVSRDTDGNGGAGLGVTDDGSGNSVESGGTAEVLPEFVYTPVQARFAGIELSGKLRLIELGGTLDLGLQGDLVRAINTSTGLALPRIAPARLGATLTWSQGPWGMQFGVRHVMAQSQVPVGQLPTAAYTLVNASVSWQHKLGPASTLWYARMDNLGDALAYSASSILTQTAPGKAPLPGRNLKLGMQLLY